MRTAALCFAVLLLAAPESVWAQAVAEAPAAAHTYHPGIDVLDYELSIQLPDTGALIHGRAQLTLRRTAPVDTLRLDLLDLQVDSVLVQGEAAPFRRTSDRILIPLPDPAGDELRVVVRYRGAPRDGLIIRTDAHGRWTGFGDNWPNRARHWIPSVDHPSDKATVTWIIEAPADRMVVGNGVLVGERVLAAGKEGGARQVTTWRLDRPIPTYLMVIGVAAMIVHDLGDTACGWAEAEEPGGRDARGCVPQAVYAAPEVRDWLPGPFALAGEITELFATFAGPYPYPRLAHVQSLTRFGGMENATAIFYADRLFRDRNLRPGLIAHETAHQWFGNAVTAREWAHLWLSEGFASYWEPLWIRHAEGDSAFRTAMQGIRQRIIASSVTLERPVIDTAETDLMRLLNTNSYQKGAFVLHMLRVQLGDSSFFRGVRSYYSRHRHGTALSGDLQRAMEDASGESLGWFFDQWLRRPGFADVTTRWSWDASRGVLVLEVEQGNRFAPFRFPLTVDVYDQDGTPHRRRVDVQALRTHRLTIPLSLNAAPVRVEIDPEVELLARYRTR